MMPNKSNGARPAWSRHQPFNHHNHSPPSPSPSAPAWRTKGTTWATSNNWRARSPSTASSTASSPKAPSPKASKKPDYQNLVVGQILFLPAIGIPSSSILWSNQVGGDPTRHPLVITKKFKDVWGVECVQFRSLTTFRGQTVEDRKPAHQQHYYVQVDSREDPSPVGGAQTATFEAGSDVLAKRSYVNLSPNSTYEVEYTHLEIFRGYPSVRLDIASISYIQSRTP